MRIGIVAQEQDEDSFGVRKDYLSLIEYIGGTPLMIYPTDIETFWKAYPIDGLILPGGSDLNTFRYNKIPGLWNYRPNNFLEHFDTQILPNVVDKRIPIFGICRGLQTLNVFFGGTLNQHIPWHPMSTYDSHLVHEVTVGIPGDKLHDQKVNSSHHQCIDRLAPNFSVIARSRDGVIEGIYHKNLPIAAVQWHPERIYDNFSLKVINTIFS